MHTLFFRIFQNDFVRFFFTVMMVPALLSHASSQSQQNKIRIGTFTKCEVTVSKGNLNIPLEPKDSVITSFSGLNIPVRAELDDFSFKGTLEIRFPQKTSPGTWTKWPSRITFDQALSTKVILKGTLNCSASPSTVYYTVNAFTAASTVDQACPLSGQIIDGNVSKGNSREIEASGTCSFSIFDIAAPNYDYQPMTKIFYTGGGIELTNSNVRITFSINTKMYYSFDRVTGPLIGVSPSNLEFKADPKGSSQTQKLRLSNDGSGQLDYAISVSTVSGGNWLSVTPSSGSVQETMFTDIDIIVNPSLLSAEDSYAGQLTITAASAGNSPVLVPVTLKLSSKMLSLKFDPPKIKCGEWTTLNISVVDKDNNLLTDYEDGAGVKLLKDLSTDKITRMDEFQNVLISKGKAQPIFIYTPKIPYHPDSAITRRTVLSGKLFIEVKPENSMVKKDTAKLTIYSPIDFYINNLEVQQGVKDIDREVQLEYQPGVKRPFPVRNFIADHFTTVRAFVKYKKTLDIPFSKMEYEMKGKLGLFKESGPVQTLDLGTPDDGTIPDFQVKDTFSIQEKANLKDALTRLMNHTYISKSGQYIFDVSLDLNNLEQVEEEKANNEKEYSAYFTSSKYLRILGITGRLKGESPLIAGNYLTEHLKRSFPLEENKLIINNLNTKPFEFENKIYDFSFNYWNTLHYLLGRHNEEQPENQCQYILCLSTPSLTSKFANNASGVADGIYGKACVIENSPSAPFITSHEMGHLLGLKDTYKASLGYSDPFAYLYVNGDPNPRRSNVSDIGNWVEEGNISLYDGKQSAGISRYHDIMSADSSGVFTWIDRVSLDHLYKELVLNPGKAAQIKKSEADGYIAVSGSIDENDKITLNPLIKMATVPSVDDSLQGFYRVAFYDKNDKNLASYKFDVALYIPEVMKTDFIPFSFYFPFPAGSKKMRILKQISEGNQSILTERVLSDNKPVVTIITPGKGQPVTGNYKVEWTAYDTDGDALTYDLAFSPDGNSKHIVATNLTTTTYNWNSSLFRNCTSGSLTVIASDGVNDGFAKSDSLKLNNNTEITETRESSYDLEQNFPNPFSHHTTIGFTIPNPGYVILRIYDILGNEISVLLNKELPEGRHTAEWNAEGSSPGIYFYQLRCGDFTATKKLMMKENRY